MSATKFTIHDFPTGPYPGRVRIALQEKNLVPNATFVTVDLFKGEHKTPEFLKTKSYSGTVPVLELDDGTFITECTAIIQYLDTLDGNPTLTGATPKEQALIHMLNKQAEIEVLDPISVYFHHATPGLGPEVEVYQNNEWGLKQHDRALKGLRRFDDVLQTRPYVAGDTFTNADITLIGGLLFAGMVNIEIPEDLVALKGWWERVQQRDSFKNRVTISHPNGL